MRNSFALALALGGVAACASTSPKPAFDEVAKKVEARSGHALRLESDAKAEAAVDWLLARELTVDAAVEVALLENAGLKAKLEDLAIGQADLVQAGLLKNPVFGLGLTAWDQEHIQPNVFATVEQDFLDLLTLPLRKRVAAAELEATKLAVADEILELAAEVRSAFYAAQGAEQVARMREGTVNGAATSAAELARRQYAAGTMNDLALSTELGLVAQTALERRRSESEAKIAREKLNKLMGLWGARTGWRMAPRLPELPMGEPALERVEELAIAQRFDVDAARRNVDAMGAALSLAKTTRWTGTVNVSVEAARTRATHHVTFGPSVMLEIPLFDQRQARIAKLEAYHRRAEDSLRALAIDVRADARAARAKVDMSRFLVEQYGKVIVPLREAVVRYSQEQYDAMLLGAYQLIAAKQGEFESYREYIEALRDYWIARSDLERVVGGRIGTPPVFAPAPASSPPPPADHHHHHSP